jgi:hypothetical protein
VDFTFNNEGRKKNQADRKENIICIVGPGKLEKEKEEL